MGARRGTGLGWAIRRPALTWWAAAVGWGVAAVALLLLLHGFYRRELNHFTGDAQWMWSTEDLHDPTPTAALFFHGLELSRRPQRAVAKVCGDRQYVLWINGQPASAGHNRPGFRLDVVDVTDLLVSGENVVAVEARSPTSVGGVLFALDLFVSAEGRRSGDPYGRSCLVSGPGWRVRRAWGDGPGRLPEEGWSAPVVWGRPPDHPWTYPEPDVHRRTIVQAIVSDAREVDQCVAPGDAGRWSCELPPAWTGYLVLELDGGQIPERIGGDGRDAPARPVEVVTLDGQREWLFPGRLQSSLLVIEGSSRPERITIFDALE